MEQIYQSDTQDRAANPITLWAIKHQRDRVLGPLSGAPGVSR
jgi:hypothetical protein